MREQAVIDQDKVPWCPGRPLQRFLRRVDGFDPTAGKKPAETERDQFYFFSDFIDEENGNRLTLRHEAIPGVSGSDEKARSQRSRWHDRSTAGRRPTLPLLRVRGHEPTHPRGHCVLNTIVTGEKHRLVTRFFGRGDEHADSFERTILDECGTLRGRECLPGKYVKKV